MTLTSRRQFVQQTAFAAAATFRLGPAGDNSRMVGERGRSRRGPVRREGAL